MNAFHVHMRAANKFFFATYLFLEQPYCFSVTWHTTASKQLQHKEISLFLNFLIMENEDTNDPGGAKTTDNQDVGESVYFGGEYSFTSSKDTFHCRLFLSKTEHQASRTHVQHAKKKTSIKP
jgi:hypothetical protein